MKLPKQECAGRFCPIFDNLVTHDHEIVCKIRGLKTIDLPPEKFAQLEHVGEIATRSGSRMRATFGTR